MRLCACVHLAINLTAPQGGLDDVEQSIRQAFALPHPPPGLFAGRTHVPVWQRGKRQKQTHRQPEASCTSSAASESRRGREREGARWPLNVRLLNMGCTMSRRVGEKWSRAAKTPSVLVCFLTSFKQLPHETSSFTASSASFKWNSV